VAEVLWALQASSWHGREKGQGQATLHTWEFARATHTGLVLSSSSLLLGLLGGQVST
jgi:hypothetical protein